MVLQDYIATTLSGYTTDVLVLDARTIIILGFALFIVTGLALYKAGKLGEKTWFWGILTFHTTTLGILPLLYLYLRRNKKV